MNLPPFVQTILQSQAPTLLAGLLLPPPFNILASAVVSGAMRAFLPAPDVPGLFPPVDPRTAPPLTPDEVVQTIVGNAARPDFLPQLREAEAKLVEYEAKNGIRFAEIAAADKASSRAFQKDSGIAGSVMRWGMVIVALSIASMMAIVVGCLLLISGAIRIPAEQSQLAMGVFGLIGAIVGYVSGYGKDVIGFYFGNSQGSADKNATIDNVLQTQAAQLGSAAAAQSQAAQSATKAAVDAVVASIPASAPQQTTAPVAAPVWRQGPFGGLRWQLTPDGILDEGETTIARTVGEPVTVRRIWRDFGPLIRTACANSGVPAELVVAVIATESRGVPAASLTEPDARVSVGLMQTLTGTASEMLGRVVTAEDLTQPALSIQAGTLYLAHVAKSLKTQFDPILTAAAYNAGGLYPPRQQDDNLYNLRVTGDHLSRVKLWYNDTVAVSKLDAWFAGG